MPPTSIDQAVQLAARHHQAGRLADAETIYRQVLAERADHPDALHLLGVVALQTGRSDLAIELIGRALAANPASAAYHMNVGIALRQKWRLDDAVAAYRQAIQLQNDFPEAHNNLGNALTCQGKLEEAIAAYETAIRLRPAYAEALCNLGFALTDLGKLDEAAAACFKVIEINPGSGAAHNNLGNIFKDQGLIEEALASYDRAIALAPNDASAHSNRLYLLHFLPRSDAASIYAEHSKWNQNHAARLSSEPGKIRRNAASGRIKIGYVSPDLSSHPVGRFLLPLLEHHDRSQFEVFCYSDVRKPDGITDRLRRKADTWRNVTGVSDDQVAQLVRDDAIDILVDLSMHSAHNRLLVFARKPVPVQVTYLAYCSTTGLTAMDYRFTDAYIDPPGTGGEIYSERSIRLETYWCYEPGFPTPAVEPPPALANGYITFGCLNNFAKVSADALTVWSKLLRDVPQSRLLLHAREGSHRQRVRDKLAQAGVDPARVMFEGPLPTADYFKLYHCIDIGLDPFPCAGGTTTCDALWMGVPVVTLSGKTAMARSGVSILSNAGMAQWIAHSQEEYLRLAMELARDVPRLAALRAGLRSRMQHSLLMDAPRFARNVEAAFHQMWNATIERP